MKGKVSTVDRFIHGLHEFIVKNPQVRKHTRTKKEVEIQAELRPLIIRYLEAHFTKGGHKDTAARANTSFYRKGQEGGSHPHATVTALQRHNRVRLTNSASHGAQAGYGAVSLDTLRALMANLIMYSNLDRSRVLFSFHNLHNQLRTLHRFQCPSAHELVAEVNTCQTLDCRYAKE